MIKTEEVSGAKSACGTLCRRLERRRAMIEALDWRLAPFLPHFTID